MIRRLVQRFRKLIGVNDLPRFRRSRDARNKVNIQGVEESIDDNPRTSTHSTELGISRRSLQRIIRDNFHLSPYKVQLVQELKPRDHLRLHDLYREQDNVVNNFIMSNEADFEINGRTAKYGTLF